MFKNYLKIAFRNILKQKTGSIINIFGLAIGIAVCLMIFHYVTYEKSYDKFNKNYDRIYRIRYERMQENGDAVRFASCCPPAASNIRGQFPEIEAIGRLLNTQASVSYLDTRFFEERIFFVEPELFRILDFELLIGNAEVSLAEPGNAFISESMAEKYFGGESPIGKTISTDKTHNYLVVGIFKDSPSNSHIKIDFMLPWKDLEAQYGPSYYEAWGHTGSYTYTLVKEGYTIDALPEKFQEIVQRECPWLEQYKMEMFLPLQPLSEIHLNSHFMQEYEVNGNETTVNFLSTIAIFIIVMAWVNYINLSTAFSLSRAKEVGIRKVAGASRKLLSIQFFMEVIIINFFAFLLAALLILLLSPLFGNLTNIPKNFSIWSQSSTWITLVIMFVLGVILSGSYPVFAMTSFKPITVLKGKFASSHKGSKLRQILVVFQFTIAIALIISTFTVFQQIKFLQQQDLGFDIEQVLVVTSPRVRDDAFPSKFKRFKDQLLANPNIEQISHTTEVPGKQTFWDAGGIVRVGEDDAAGKNYQIIGCDAEFADMFDMKFVAGRNFSEEFGNNDSTVLLNEKAVEHLGFTNAEDAVGKQINYWGNIFDVVGVLKNYHQESPKMEFEPHIYRYMPLGRRTRGQIALKINTADARETVKLVKQHYDEMFPGNSFDTFFLDDYFNQQYKSDELLGDVFTLFAVLAIIITALGIYGLSSFTINQRQKEIGIRKVLGSSVLRIVFLIIKDQFIMILVSFIIIAPLAVYGLNRWLNTYASRISLSAIVFIASIILVCMVVFATVAYRTIKAALANPIESLKYE
ncbi:MAG: ABC transporter permease [Candidatus Marinimicrobia bacterium]|nr:ABC transporter permease [Candidatus Neomarinimicrobiota bacterium]